MTNEPTRSPFGIAHPTVVPANYRPDEPADDVSSGDATEAKRATSQIRRTPG